MNTMPNMRIILVLAAFLAGCASLPKHPALRTAWIAVGAAFVAGAYQDHQNQQDPQRKAIPRPPRCHDKDDCR